MSKSLPEVSDGFDCSEYVLGLLAANESNEWIRWRIKSDIESTRRQLSEQLLAFDIDLSELNTNYNQLIGLKKQMNECETQLNAWIASDLSQEINDLKDICRQNNDRSFRSQELRDFTDKLRQIYGEMGSIDHSFSVNSYEMSFRHMSNASELLKQLMNTIETNTDLKPLAKELAEFLQTIKTDLVVKREELIYNTKTMFNSNVKAFRDEFNNENVFEFNLINYLSSHEYKNFIKAFVEMRENEPILKELIKCLNLYFVKTILNEEVNDIVLEDNRITAVLSTTSTATPLSLLKTFFDYLSQTVTDKNNIPESRQLLRLLGQFWTEDIFDQILKYYLNRLMPKNESDIKSYLSLVDAAEDIRHFLIEIGFIDDNTNSPFIEFALNINSHFCRRLCTDFLLESKAIICRDLHQTVAVGSDENPTATSFPSCRVSEFIVELKQLMDRINDLSVQCSADCSNALIQTMTDVCELFVDISPVFHNKMITEFPQQNAIFHNNCMFFANFMEVFALKHKSDKTFAEFVVTLRELGSQVFLKQMRTQEKNILDLIQSHQFAHCINDLVTIEDSNSAVGDQLAKEFRQILTQCLVHLNFLRQTLVDVLPQRVYDKAIGTVINTLFNGLINKILIQNDISSSGAQRLSQEIEFLFAEVKTFLKTENPMRLVSKWSKLSELNFVLNANLLEIVNRWADGYGILAAEFTAPDVKQLIRVLFQNTERRAQALNKITSH